MPGSTYDLVLVDGGNFQTFKTITATANTPQPFLLGLNGGTGTITESEQALPRGSAEIDFVMKTDVDIFPTGFSPNMAQAGLGENSDPVKLSVPFDLTSALMTVKNGGGTVIGFADFIGAVAQPSPWNGFFPATFGIIGFTGIQGDDSQEIDLQFISAPTTPEPGILALLASGGLTAAGAIVRKRRRR